jgi:hypothetical protein
MLVSRIPCGAGAFDPTAEPHVVPNRVTPNDSSHLRQTCRLSTMRESVVEQESALWLARPPPPWPGDDPNDLRDGQTEAWQPLSVVTARRLTCAVFDPALKLLSGEPESCCTPPSVDPNVLSVRRLPGESAPAAVRGLPARPTQSRTRVQPPPRQRRACSRVRAMLDDE